MNRIIGYISGSAKHRHKAHVLVEIGPPSDGLNECGRDEGKEYEAKYAVTACGLDTRTLSKKRWTAPVLGPMKGDEGYVCGNCLRRARP